jgi:hypothetical protein
MILDTNLLLLLLKFLNNFFIFVSIIFLFFYFRNTFIEWFYWISDYFFKKKKIYYYIFYWLSIYLLYKNYSSFSMFFFVTFTNIPFFVKTVEKTDTIERYEFLKLVSHIYWFFQSQWKKYMLMFQFKNKKNIFNQTFLKNKKKFYIWHIRWKKYTDWICGEI